MANSLNHSLPWPVKNAKFTLPLSFRLSTGVPTDPTTPDTEFSTDGGATFTDCANEITTGGANGMGYLTLTGAETNAGSVLIAAKSANCLTTPAVVVPRVLPILLTGTASAGGNTSITLAAGGYDLTGCIVRTTGGTGGGGTGGANNQARIITAYNTSTFAATVEPAWETNPDATTTYDILLTEMATNTVVTRGLRPTTDGRTLDISAGGEAGLDWANVGSPTTTNALTGTTIAVTQKVDVETIKTRTVTAAGTVVVGGFVGQDTAAIGVNASGHVSRVTLADLITAYTGNTVQTGDSFGRIGVAGVGLTNVILPSGGLANVSTWTVAITGNVTGNLSGSVGSLAAQAKADVNAEADTALADAKAGYAIAIEAAILNEGDATALLAAIAAKVEEFLINEGDASATMAAIATAVRTNLATELARIDVGVSTRGTGAALTAGDVRTAIGLGSANLDTQLGDLPTNAELATALGTADDAVLTAVGDVPTNAEFASAMALLATSAQAVKLLAAVYDSTTVDPLTGIITLSDGHTQTISATGRLTA